MLTLETIRNHILPVPQKVMEGAGDALLLTEGSKFCLSAPSAEKGPVKTAAEEITAFLQQHYGQECLSETGIPVTLELGDAPEEVKIPSEGYRICINQDGITITGFGESGLYYGVVSLKQLWLENTLPAVEILDWPDFPMRGIKEECRYGSNMMEKQDWLTMIDDLAFKKMNRLSIGIYGCWGIQYDGKVAQYLYLPLKDYPQLQTPQTVKYYSPSEDKWYNYETLPPIYRDNFLGEIIRYAKDRGIDIIPGINSFGHNTLFPSQLPEVAPKDEDGNPVGTGFCTSSEETYKLLFSIYDQIIDDYMIPNSLDTFNILMDEVHDAFGIDPEHPEIKRSPWCKCDKCKDQDRGDIFINHAIKVIAYLKSRGIKRVQIANDMLVRKSAQLGYLGDRFMEAARKAGVDDVLLMAWWRYTDQPFTFMSDFLVTDPDSIPVNTIFCPYNGYYIWNCMNSHIRNIKLMADLGQKSSRNMGMIQYAMWDKSFDRLHDCLADYAWNYQGAGDVTDVTARHAARNFPTMQEETIRAFRLMEWISEERSAKKDPEAPHQAVINSCHTLNYQLTYYPHCYYSNTQDFPRNFPGWQLEQFLPWRRDYERYIYTMASMAREAAEIFRAAAQDPACNQPLADRLAYECENLEAIGNDWIAFFRIYDLTQAGQQKKILSIAKKRYDARIALMKRCQHVKEDWVQKGATMRNLSVFMQIFADIVKYMESTDEPQLNMLDLRPIMSPENRMLR